MNNVIKNFGSYNQRRYGQPWACKMTTDGKYNFEERVAVYTGNKPGDEGDLVILEPVKGQVYGYGQKDYRGGNTWKEFAIWDGEQFKACDMLGRVKED